MIISNRNHIIISVCRLRSACTQIQEEEYYFTLKSMMPIFAKPKSHMKRIISAFVIFMLFSLPCFSQQVLVTERLSAKMKTINPIQYTRVLILLKDRVDIESLDKELYDINAPLSYRAELVIKTLKDKALATQQPLLDYLNQQKQIGKVRELISYWITNMIYVDATGEILHNLTKRSDIDVLDLDAELEVDQPYDLRLDSEGSIESVETGLKVIKADSCGDSASQERAGQ